MADLKTDVDDIENSGRQRRDTPLCLDHIGVSTSIDTSLANNIYEDAISMYQVVANDYIQSIDTVLHTLNREKCCQHDIGHSTSTPNTSASAITAINLDVHERAQDSDTKMIVISSGVSPVVINHDDPPAAETKPMVELGDEKFDIDDDDKMYLHTDHVFNQHRDGLNSRIEAQIPVGVMESSSEETSHAHSMDDSVVKMDTEKEEKDDDSQGRHRSCRSLSHSDKDDDYDMRVVERWRREYSVKVSGSNRFESLWIPLTH